MSAPLGCEQPILAISNSANFYPEMDDPESFDGSTITWTFELPKAAAVGPGVYRIEFVRSLAEEKALGNPVRNATATIGKPGNATAASDPARDQHGQ